MDDIIKYTQLINLLIIPIFIWVMKVEIRLKSIEVTCKLKKIKYDQNKHPIYWAAIDDNYFRKISKRSSLINKIQKVYGDIDKAIN